VAQVVVDKTLKGRGLAAIKDMDSHRLALVDDAIGAK
jgi:hypothetical protein